MKTKVYYKKYVLMAMTLLICSSSMQARRRPVHPTLLPRGVKSHIIIINHTKPSIKIVQRFSQQERWNMLVTYLKSHTYISIKDYKAMTGLKKDIAEAELEAFTLDRKKNLSVTLVNKKKMYMLRP